MMSLCSNDPVGKTFIESVEELWLWIEEKYKKLFSKLANFIQNSVILKDNTPGSIFPSVTLNMNGGIQKKNLSISL